MNVLWLTPNKAKNISVGRRRIASYLEEDGIDIELRPGGLQNVISVLRDTEDYDVIVGTTRAGAIAGLIISTVVGRPFVVDHVDPIRQFEETSPLPLARAVRYLECLAFRQSSHTLYVYPEEERRVRRFAPCATRTALGVDYGRFADPDPSVLDVAREELDGYDLNRNLAIYIGGLEPIYHIQNLVDSISYSKDWSLLLLGSGSQSEYVTNHSDGKEVLFLGTVPHEDVPGYVHAADVGVSLVDDPHTLKVLEYGASRLPTVQLAGRAEEKLGGMVEFCSPDPTSIATAIERAKNTDQTAIDRLQELAAEYRWERIADQYAEVLRSVHLKEL